MRTKKKAYLVIVILLTGAVSLLAQYEGPPETKPLEGGLIVNVEVIVVDVRKVIDGDTIIVGRGEKVRYIGIDTPERGEPLYREATKRNSELVKGKRVELRVCPEEPRDKYGRLLAWVYADGADVGGRLVREGLARTLVIPPCGLKKAREFARYENKARTEALGLWGLPVRAR